MVRQGMKLAPDINPTLKEFWKNTREPGEPFCRRCGIPEYTTARLGSFELAGQSFYLCDRCQKAIWDALCPAPSVDENFASGPKQRERLRKDLDRLIAEKEEGDGEVL